MLDYRPVLFILGFMLMALATAMAVPAVVDLAEGHADWAVFVAAMGVTYLVGGSLFFTMRGGSYHLNLRQAYLFTAVSWSSVALFGAVPFMFSELELSIADAVFETISGITTTGGTVIVGLDDAPPGILVWRGMLQWLGGIGLIAMAIIILPFLRVGGMQLFRIEASNVAEKVLPRTGQIVAYIALIYGGLSALCVAGFLMAGMSFFDAALHAMATLSTGGFSTRDASIGAYHNPAIEWIAIVFMIAGGAPFLVFIRAVRGQAWIAMRDPQLTGFLFVLAVASLAITAWLVMARDMDTSHALRAATFSVVSVVTTTGFVTDDFSAWGTFAEVAFLFLMFVGGCGGSTSGGIKVFRLQIMGLMVRNQMRRMIEPAGVFPAIYAGQTVTDDIMRSAMAFLFAFLGSWVLLSLALSALGLDLVTSVSASISALSNVGPALGPIAGPAGTFAPLPDLAKWLLSAGMLFGRLEFFVFLVFLTRWFWRA
ncbi:MAG: TrkH family potassium uptake protein [Alphaproteobacteria bacterium]